MKALTLWQPWASLVAVGAKTIETRSWSASYRGPLAIHASRRRPNDTTCQDVGDWQVLPDGSSGWSIRHTPTSAKASRGQRLLGALYPAEIGRDYGYRVLPLGAVVATCTLVDVVPIIDDNTGPRVVLPHFSVAPAADGWLFPAEMPELGWYPPEDEPVDRRDQLPYGDFSPGRFAWLLADITALAEPIPAKGRQGLWEWAA